MAALKFSKKKIREALTSSVINTFESMAFIDTAPLPKYSGETESKPVLLIEIKKPCYGSLSLYLPLNFKKLILENIYGRDFQELKTTDIDDALLEILNVMGGNFLQNLYGSKTTYQLGIPRVVFEKSDISLRGKKKCCFYYDAEGHTFKIMLACQGEV